MNTVMAHTALEANSFYRHKKFDQAKRKRTDSSSSTSSDGELRNGLEIERKIYPFLKQISNVNMSHFNWPVLEIQSKRNNAPGSNTNQELPAAKRSCNYSVDDCELSTKRPESFAVSTTTQQQQANILSVLEKGFKRRFTPDVNTYQELPLAKRPCAASSTVPNTDQYMTAIFNSDQHLPPVQRPYAANVISNDNQHVPLTQRNCTSTVTSKCDQYVAPAQGSNNSYVRPSLPALGKEAQRNLPVVADADQNMAPPTRPRSFSASVSRSAYPFLRLTQPPLTNTPLALTKLTKTVPTLAFSTNQHATIKPAITSPQKPCAYTLTSASHQHKTPVPKPGASTASPSSSFAHLTSASYQHKTPVPKPGASTASPSSSFAHLTPLGMANILPDFVKERKTNFAAALNTDQDITPLTRQRSFSAGTGSFAYSTQPQWANTSLTFKKHLNRGLTTASNTDQSPAQTLPIYLSDGKRSTFSLFGKANSLSPLSNKESKRPLTTALNADHNIAPTKRPRSFSASTSSSTSSFASLTQLCRANKTISPPVIPSTAAILPKISHDTLRNICKYHGNMVRKFPKKERTPKDQERRNKNTIACRMSRRVKKLEHIAIEEQYKEFTEKTIEIIEMSMRATAYLHELMKLCKSPEEEIESPAELTKNERLLGTTTQAKKPFTIAFLAGTEEK